ncbi:hypothetical protein Cni_G15875 [Canna indica]|uniref:Uncharacterized protein n=1 Tax=Canna indica TaxID=4628 RepID=A0AAQ3QFC8_9LILI|nr:hypothetical protein Cni_G15875 [Canna indica]
MKCTWHPFEGGVGVCASCLRERLLALTAPAQAAPSPERRHGKHSHRFPSPPILPFPRSVSPYMPRAAAAAGPRRSSSFLSIFFGRRGSGNRHWQLSELLRGRRKKKTSRMLSADNFAAVPVRNRGMCPESSSGLWSEAAGWYDVEPAYWSGREKPQPVRAATAKHQNQGVGDLAGYAMCCSPLVTVRTTRQQSCVSEIGFSGEIARPTIRPHHRRHASAGGPLLCTDRSRKLTEFVSFR